MEGPNGKNTFFRFLCRSNNLFKSKSEFQFIFPFEELIKINSFFPAKQHVHKILLIFTIFVILNNSECTCGIKMERLMMLLRLQLWAPLSVFLIWKEAFSAFRTLSFCLTCHPMRFIQIHPICHWSPQAAASLCCTATARDRIRNQQLGKG